MTDVYEPPSRNSGTNTETEHLDLDPRYQESIRSDAAFIDNASSFIRSTADLDDGTNLSLFSKNQDSSPIQAPQPSSEPVQSNALSGLSVSRPLSRSSMTSGLSVTATKDGIEGKRVKKQGIPGYPLNLINKMYANYSSKLPQSSQLSPGLSHSGSNNHLNTESFSDDAISETTSASHLSGDQADDGASILSLSSMIPQYSRDDTPGFTQGHIHRGLAQESPDLTLQDENDFNYTLESEKMVRDDTMGLEEADDDYSKFLRRSASEKKDSPGL